MNAMQKRILSMLLCLTMIIGLVPISASAEDEHIDAETVETAEEVPSEDKATEEANSEDADTPEETETVETPENSDEEAGETKESEVSETSGENGKSEDAADEQNAGEDPEVSLAATSKVATVSISGTPRAYYDIVEAFDAAQSATSQPVEILLEDFVDIDSQNIVISKDCDIIFDLNGYDISGTYGVENSTTPDGLIVLGGSGNPKVTLTITNSYGSSEGKITNKSVNDCTSVIRVASTNAKLNIYDGTFQRTGYNVTSMNAAVIDVAFGSAEISGGTIKGNVYGITAESGAKSVTVEGEADVYGYYAAINSLNDANVNLSGGTFSSIGSKQTFKTINGGAIGALLADGYAFYDENGVLVDRNTSSSSFTENVSVLEGLVPVKYIDKNGNEASVTNYTSLTGDPDGNKLDGTTGEAWYVVSGGISATQNWDVAGNVNIILTDGSTLSTDGHYFEVAKDAVITVYAQKEGTGILSINSTVENVSALGGTERLYKLDRVDSDGNLYILERGSLAVYGGNVKLESTKYQAALLTDLIVMGGTVTAKAPEKNSTMSLKNSPTLAENYKICRADDPQEKSGYGYTDGRTVLITECTQHLFRHKSSETAGKHISYCTLCSVSIEEDHVFNVYGGECDENTHSLKCECGVMSDAREAHDFKYYQCADTLTHSKECKVCKYGMDGTIEEHNFSEDPTLCSECGFKRAASVKIGDTLTNHGTLIEALGKAGGSSILSKTDGVVTLYGGKDCFPENTDPSKPLITIGWGRFTLDFNGAELSFPRTTLFRLDEYAEVTFKNGKIDLSGNTSSGETPGIIVNKGGLTLENMEIYAACNAFSNNDHIQYPAVKIAFKSKAFTAKNVVFGGGVEIGGGVSVTPFTDSSFIYSCDTASYALAAPVIKVDGNDSIAGLIAEGYTLAKSSDPNELIFMCNYDENGVRKELTEIDESVTVVPHAEHTFEDGYCLCGYRCDHTDGFNADGKCNICGAQAVASIGDEMFSELTPAFARANELSAQTGENVKINIIADLGSLAERGVVTKKVTLELNGHNLESSKFYVGTRDNDGNVTAEGDLTITDSSELKTGIISSVTLNGGALTVTGGKSNYGFTLYGGTAHITDHETGNINIDNGTVNLTGGNIRSIIVNNGGLTISDSTVESLSLRYSVKANIFGGTITRADVTGGELNFNDGTIEELNVSGGTVTVSDGVVENFKVTDGKAEIADGIIQTFTMTAGYTRIENGNFDIFAVSIADTDSLNPELVIEGGAFENAQFAAKTKGRITLYGGTFTRSIKVTDFSGEVRTVGDLLASNYMFYEIDDSGKSSLIFGDTERFDDKKIAVRRHRHSFNEKTDSNGKFYGECECGVKAEAAIESTSGTRSYYATFVEAAAKVGNGETLTLCTDVNCEGNVTIEQKGNSKGHITLNLDGHSLNFAEENKLSLLDSYVDVIDDASESGYISHIYVNWSSTKLYGGSYGQIDADANMMKGIRGNGYGYCSKTDGWVKNPDVLSLTDVAVRKAPYSVDAIVTNTPDGTTTPGVIYPGQKLYFKLIFRTNSSLDPISESNPAACSVDYIRADGKTRVVGTNVTVTGNDAFISEILPEDASAGTYTAKFENIEFYGCTQDIDVPFNVEICSHESYTNGYCDTCGYACKHPDVSEDGVCGTCGSEFTISLTTTDGTMSYYANAYYALGDATLEKNRGCTLKLFKSFTEGSTTELYLMPPAEVKCAFTIDLNGFNFGSSKSLLSLQNIDLTIKTSTKTTTAQSPIFNPRLYIESGSSLICPDTEGDGWLAIYDLRIRNSENNISLGTGVYLLYFGTTTSFVAKYDDILADGCIARNTDTKKIYTRSTEIPGNPKIEVIKCTHSEWNGNECKYCGLVCDHPKGFVDGICPDCGRVCEHPNLDENFYCPDCEQQMGVKIESPASAITYIPLSENSLAEAVNAAENGSRLTLLADVNFTATLDRKTLTLDFNGKSVTGGWFEVGKLTLGGQYGADVIAVTGGAKLILTGHSAKEDYNSSNVTERGLINVYNGNTLVTDGWSGTLGGINASRYFDGNKPTIQIDSGTFCSISLQNGTGFTIGDFLKAGYAFKYTDGSGYLPYNHELVPPDFEFFNISVVKCEEHHIEGEGNTCEYCGTEFTASVVDGDGTLYKYYPDIKDAVKAQLELGDTYTVKLLRDFLTNAQLTLSEGSPRIDLNGHTVKEMWLNLDCRATILGTGKITNLTISNDAGVNAAVTVAENIWIMQGATWSSILPNESFGYKVNNDDGSYKWYDIDTIAEVTDSSGQLKNASIEPLPVSVPKLTLNKEPIMDGDTMSVYKPYTFGVMLDNIVEKCTIYYKWNGETRDCPATYSSNGYYEGNYKNSMFGTTGSIEFWTVITNDGYTRTSEPITLNIGKADLSEAKITLKNGGKLNCYAWERDSFTELTMEIDSVKYFALTLTADDYTVVSGDKGTNVGSYTLKIEAKENSNFVGSASAEWEILPCELEYASFAIKVKPYDGTTDITLENSVFGLAEIDFYCPSKGASGGDIKLIKDTDYEIKIVSNTFTDPNANAKGKVTYIIKLLNPNFAFDNGSDTKEFTRDHQITVAKKLPEGYEPNVGTLVVRNGVKNSYTFEVSEMLKKLPEELSYNSAEISTVYYLKEYGSNGASLVSLDSTYYTENTASIDENGTLTLPINEVKSTNEGSIGTVKVRVLTQNYDDFYVTVNVTTANRIVPTGAPELSRERITYGETRGSVKLSGTMRDEVNKVEVTGAFAWKGNTDTVPNVGSVMSGWIFTPDNLVLYAPVEGYSLFYVDKAELPEDAIIKAPAEILDLVYQPDISTPQVLHTKGEVRNNLGKMMYTLGDPESEDTVWSEEPIASRNAGEFTVYYKVFGDENHLDSAYGEIKCSIAKYKLTYSVVCLPKVYDGTTNGNPKKIDNVKFYSDADSSKEMTGFVNGTDYTVDKIEYKSENVGENLGTLPVDATATLSLIGDAAVNYTLADNGKGKASGLITPAPFTGIDFNSYTYEICYGETTPRSVTLTYFGADKLNYEIVSTMDVGNNDILSKIDLVDNSYFNFAVKDGLKGDAVSKSVTVKFNIYSKDHNYRSEELTFTVKLIDKATPDLNVKEIKTVYNNKPVPASLIDGTATIDGHEISGTWSWENGESPTNVSDSREYTVLFEPTDSHLYYGVTAPVKVTVTPREIGDKDITFTYGESFVYTGNVIIPYIDGEYKYDENKALGLVENNDYTLTYPEDATNVGKKKITVTGHGNFDGTTELEYEITPSTQPPFIDLELPENGYVYDGTDKTPSVTVKVSGTVLTEGKDYELAYSNNRNAKDGAKVTVTAKGNYGFEPIVRYFSIAKADSVIDTEPASNSFTYDALSHGLLIEGKATGGSFRYKLGDGGWVRDIPKVKDAGEYTVWYKVAGDSNHNDTGEKSVKVTIERKDIADADIVLGPSLTYNTKEQVQTVFHAKFERFNATYDVENNRATNAGTYKLKVIGTGNFKGEREVEFTIAKKEVTANVTAGGEYIYNGKDIEPADITVRDGEDIIPDTEYTVSFGDNRNAGTAKVAITNAEGGNYIVNGTGEFEIKKANITVKPKDIFKIYGAAPEFKLESDSDLITEEELAAFASSAKFTSEGTAKTAKVIDGGYEITAVLAENETHNLILTLSGTGILTVVPKKLTITVNDVSRIYGEPNPELSVSYDGFIDGEDESVLDGALVLKYNDDINETAAIGLHENAATASGLTANNYAIEFISGNVTITKIQVTADTGTSRSSYITIKFDKAVVGLTAANFKVTDENGEIPLTKVSASSDNMTYTLNGSFRYGTPYTVEIDFTGAVADAVQEITNKTLSVKFSRPGNGTSTVSRYTVKFETNGAGAILSQKVSEGALVKEPTAPEKKDYVFGGWYTDEKLTTKYDFTEKVTKNFTLYAAWKKASNTANEIILTIGEKTALVFGVEKTNDVAPIIRNNRTMLPARFVAENLGAAVEWDAENRVVTITGKNLKTGEAVKIEITIGSDHAKVNGKLTKLDSAAFIENNRTYTPVRFIAENLGADVDWNEGERKVIITKP